MPPVRPSMSIVRLILLVKALFVVKKIVRQQNSAQYKSNSTRPNRAIPVSARHKYCRQDSAVGYLLLSFTDRNSGRHRLHVRSEVLFATKELNFTNVISRWQH